MQINAPTALIIGKTQKDGNFSGIGNRVDEIRHFLKEIGFESEYLVHGDIPKYSQYDVICISSFVIAMDLVRYKRYSNFLWLDAMDSWKLTRRSLFRENPIKESSKIIRDYVGSKCFSKADLLTYCSVRDSHIDRQSRVKPFIFSPSQIGKFELRDHGSRYVFVGSSSYYPNRKAFKYLTHLAKLGLFEKHQLQVYGDPVNYHNRLPDIQIHGEAPNIEVYGTRDIHLVPLWRGAGVKYKTLLPLSQGLRVISSLEGANGINRSSNLLIAKDPSQFKEFLENWGFLEKPEIEVPQLISFDQKDEIREILRSRIRKL